VDAVRAMRLADQVLRSLESHRWDVEPGAASVVPLAESASVLQGPHVWRIKSLRHSSNTSGH
jgi:hypothetical protein